MDNIFGRKRLVKKTRHLNITYLKYEVNYNHNPRPINMSKVLIVPDFRRLT